MATDATECFLLEMQSRKSRQLSEILAMRYLLIEDLQQRRMRMIRDSLKCRRDCYPYIPLPRQIKKRICLIRGIIESN